MREQPRGSAHMSRADRRSLSTRPKTSRGISPRAPSIIPRGIVPVFTSMSASESAQEGLSASNTEDLQRAYIWSINSAIESGGDVLADELADTYRCESRLLTALRLARPAA